jgi:uncharacterized protein (DUF2236 family)
VPAQPPPTDHGLFGPGSATWSLHADPMLGVAGMRALLLQALHPVAMRGVADHSSYRERTWERLSSTGEYVLTTTFGATDDALAAAARVRRIHEHVKGTDPVTGTAYRADDPDLLLWIHCALVDSVVDVVGRSRGGLEEGEADRYVAEQVTSAQLVGLDPDVVPASAADLAAYLEEVRPDLQVTRIAREAASYIIAPPMHPLLALATPARPAWAALGGLAFSAMPLWARRMYAMPQLPGASGLTAAANTLGLRTLRTALAGAQSVVPALRDPHARRAHAAAAADALAASGAPVPAGGEAVIDLTALEAPAAAVPGPLR